MKQVFSNVIVRARRDQPMKLLMQNMLSGGLAGALQIFLMYPFSFVQTRLQADVGTTPINREFRGIRDCVRKIYKTEGTQSFYRGLTVSLSGVFVYRALYFGMYDCGLTLIIVKLFNNHTQLNYIKKINAHEWSSAGTYDLVYVWNSSNNFQFYFGISI